MKSIHTSLNTAHPGCNPSNFMSSFTHSPQVFLPLPTAPTHLTPATTTFLQADNQSSLPLRSKCPNHLNLPRLTTSATLRTPNPEDHTNPHCAFCLLTTIYTSISPSYALLSPDYADFQPSLPMSQPHKLTCSGHNINYAL